MKSNKEQIRKNREAFKKDPYNYLIKPTLDYWKTQPLQAIGIFLFWAIIIYAGFTTLQAINYDMMYCNSTIPEYNGKLLNTYNPFIQEINKRIETINQQNLQLNNYQELPPQLNETINCKYNLKRWWKDDKEILQNIKKIALKQ